MAYKRRATSRKRPARRTASRKAKSYAPKRARKATGRRAQEIRLVIEQPQPSLFPQGLPTTLPPQVGAVAPVKPRRSKF